MPTGFRAHRTQILIGSAVVAVLAALGIAISLSSGVDETEPGTAAPAAAHAPSTDIDPLIAEIETALTAADDASARAALGRLRRAAPSHPRLAFFDAILKRRESPVRPRAAAPTRPAPATREATTALVARGDLPRALEPGEAAAQSSDTTAANVPDIAAPATAPAETAPAPSIFAGRTLEASGAAQESGETTVVPVPAPAPAPAPADTAPRKAITDVADLPPVVREAKLIRRSAPEYPSAAMRDGKEGAVDVAFTITADGRVTNVEVVGADLRGVFDRAALSAVKRWRYEPRIEDGTAVDWRTQVRIEFRLTEK